MKDKAENLKADIANILDQWRALPATKAGLVKMNELEEESTNLILQVFTEVAVEFHAYARGMPEILEDPIINDFYKRVFNDLVTNKMKNKKEDINKYIINVRTGLNEDGINPYIKTKINENKNIK